MVTDNTCLSDNHSRTVVDGKKLTNLGSWVDINTSLGMCQKDGICAF